MKNKITYYLKTRRIEEDKTIQNIADETGMSIARYSRRERKPDDFTLSELKQIRKSLEINDKDFIKIFFA